MLVIFVVGRFGFDFEDGFIVGILDEELERVDDLEDFAEADVLHADL